jgi:hypothetical protein
MKLEQLIIIGAVVALTLIVYVHFKNIQHPSDPPQLSIKDYCIGGVDAGCTQTLCESSGGMWSATSSGQIALPSCNCPSPKSWSFTVGCAIKTCANSGSKC